MINIVYDEIEYYVISIHALTSIVMFSLNNHACFGLCLLGY